MSPKLFQSQIWCWSISDFALLYFLSLYFILLLSLLLFQYQICNWSIQNFALHNRDSSLKLFLVLVFFNINTYWYFLFKWCPEKRWQILYNDNYCGKNIIFEKLLLFWTKFISAQILRSFQNATVVATVHISPSCRNESTQSSVKK